MTLWITLFAVGAAVLAVAAGGILGHRHIHRHRNEDTGDGLKLDTLAAPLATFAVILVSFTLVSTYSSFNEARTSATTEAGRVDELFERAGLVEAAVLRQTLQADVICYARAVLNLELPVQHLGVPAPEVRTWTTAIRNDLTRIHASEQDADLTSLLQTADASRADSRRVRLARAEPAVPFPVIVLLFGAICATILALALLAHPAIPRSALISVVSGFSILMLAAMVVVTDLDRPYAGFIQIGSDSMHHTVEASYSDYVSEHGLLVPLRCDAAGKPVS